MRRLILVILSFQLGLPLAWGWGAHVHRTITYAALDALAPGLPTWLDEPGIRHRVAFQANQADRWRGWRSVYLQHENDPEHYIDLEYLEPYGLTLETLPRLRREYLRRMVEVKLAHPERMEPYDPARDPARTHEWPGFLPYAIMEEYAQLQAAFYQVRVLEALNDPARRHQLEQARAIVVYHLGNLSHFVADAAQPLHTSKHYNGWQGDNPAGYRWRDRFHAYIDEGFADAHNLGYAELRPRVRVGVAVHGDDPWPDVIALLHRSHALLEQLYGLERDGKLDSPEGEALILGQWAEAASFYAALVQAAYEGSKPTDEQIASWVRYNGFDPNRLPPAGRKTPSTRPAPAGVP